MADQPDPLQPQQCARRLRALADPERLRIVGLLRDGPMNVSELAVQLASQVVNVSHHLGVLRRAGPPSPNCACSQDADDGHRVEPIAFTGDPAAAMKRLTEVVAARPRTRVVESTPTYLRAECVTALMRFVDDLEFLIDADRSV